ncbi:hypothetical protein AOLI_G00270950 [Acnodon oligacanthus]
MRIGRCGETGDTFNLPFDSDSKNRQRDEKRKEMEGSEKDRGGKGKERRGLGQITVTVWVTRVSNLLSQVMFIKAQSLGASFTASCLRSACFIHGSTDGAVLTSGTSSFTPSSHLRDELIPLFLGSERELENKW